VLCMLSDPAIARCGMVSLNRYNLVSVRHRVILMTLFCEKRTLERSSSIPDLRTG